MIDLNKRSALRLAALSAAALALVACGKKEEAAPAAAPAPTAAPAPAAAEPLKAAWIYVGPVAAPQNGASSGGAGFPRVDSGTQKARDTDRRRILEEELNSEQKSLEVARKELEDQESVRYGNERNYQKVLDRVQPYKDKVQLHERNIEALRREISNLR